MPRPAENLPDTLPDAIAALIPDLTRLARFLAGNRDAAQDLVQETLLRLLHRQKTLTEIDDIHGYARTILRNLYRRSLRSTGEETVADLPEIGAPPEAFAAIALQELLDIMAGLPPEQVEVLSLVLDGDTSPRSIAARTGLPEGTVMSRLARARAHLRRQLGLAPGENVSNLF